MKMFTFPLTDPKRSEEKYRVSSVHLSPRLQRHTCIEFFEFEESWAGISITSHPRCRAARLKWTSSDHHPSFLSQWKGSGALALPTMLWGSNNTETPWKKNRKKKKKYHFLNICCHSRFLPPVSWQGLVRLTWSGFKPIVRLLLQPDRARTCQLWPWHESVGCSFWSAGRFEFALLL